MRSPSTGGRALRGDPVRASSAFGAHRESKSGRLAAVTLLLAALLPGCKKPPPPRKGIGVLRMSTAARHLTLSPDRTQLVFVGEIAPPPEKGVPEGVFQGILTSVGVDGGPPRQLGGGVSTLEDGYRLSPDGRWLAYLQGFRFAVQAGSLHVAPMPTGDAREVAAEAKFYRFSPDSKLLG
jgi:hypothetical protein